MAEQRQAQLEEILKNAVDAIITIDEDGIVEEVNPATVRLFGYSASEIIGRNVKMLMPTPYRENHDQYLDNYRSTGVRKIIGIGREVLGQRKDGSVFPIHLAVSEFQSGGRRMFTGVARDITELKAATQELENVNRELENRVRERSMELQRAQAELLRQEKLAMLGQVSVGIAHEIRNPLNAIKTSAYYLLHAQNLTSAKLSEHIERIDRQVTVIDNVVTALTDIARMPAPSLRPQDVRAHVEQVLQSIDLPPTIDVETQIPMDQPIIVHVDEYQLPIVIRNLIRNARDAMPDGGKLVIGTTVQQSEIAIFVQDSGVGISPSDLKKITEPLYTTKDSGMGLGLAISKAIIEKHGGRLEIESEPGNGSLFSIVFARQTSTESQEQVASED